MTTSVVKDQQQYQQSSRDVLPVMEHFYSLQGEGYWTGTAAYFIRLAGCDVGCHWCDVKESWPATAAQEMQLDALLEAVKAAGAETVVITGGEPVMYDLQPLTRLLKNNGIRIHLETSGAYPLTGSFDWICLSPKKTAPPLAEYFQQVHELKVIVYNRDDLKWAESHADSCHGQTILYLQPEWSRPQNTEFIIPYIKEHPKWKLSLQTHKFLNIP